MKVVLRDFRTGLYLGRGRAWTRNAETARTFSNRFRASAYKICHRLPEATVVAIPWDAPNKSRARSTAQGFPSDVDYGSPTIVQARIELSPENRLFIRGEGEDLNWRRGRPLTQLDKITWIWSAHPATERVVFQLLLNDLVWAKGENISIDPGTRIELLPDFEWPEIPRVSFTDPIEIPFRNRSSLKER
jgi:hypothetical protein